MFNEIGIENLENWNVVYKDGGVVKAEPTLDEIISQNGSLKIESINLNTSSDLHNEIQKAVLKLHGKPNGSVPVEDDLSGPVSNVTYGFVYREDSFDRYIICKLESNPKGSFLASISVEVNRNTPPSSFVEGNHTQKINGTSVDTGEIISYALTLREITLQETESEKPTSATVDDFKKLEGGMSEEQVYELVGLPNRGLYETQKTYLLSNGQSVIINFSYGETEWAFILNNDDSQESLF